MKANIAIIFLLSLCACASQKKQAIRNNILTLKDSYCKAPKQYNYNNRIPSYNSDSILKANKHLSQQFTEQSILILNALGTLDEIELILSIKSDTSLAAKVKVLQLKNIINSKITIALTELDAVAAEFDCEGERVAQMANYVENINNSRNDKLILYSIIVGAGTSIASSMVANPLLANAINIGGGVVGAGLGLATWNPRGKQVEFIHKRNILKDVWSGQLISANFPPFVWYMYTEPHFSNKENISIIQNMNQRWLHYQFNDDKNAAEHSVNFGEGGYYSATDLNNRAAMLNQMQSATRTINQNFNYLLLDLDKLILE